MLEVPEIPPVPILRYRMRHRVPIPVDIAEGEDASRLPDLNAMRGTFGMALREVACITGAPECFNCPCEAECAYHRVFANGRDHGQAHQPVRYSLHSLSWHKDTFTITIDLYSIGVSDSVPVLAAWSQARKHGFGRDRLRPSPGSLVIVKANDQEVSMNAAPPLPRGRLTLDDVAEYAPRPDQPLTVVFTSPVFLKHRRQLVERPVLADLLVGIMRRVSGLSQAIGLPPLPHNSTWLDLAHSIRCEPFDGDYHDRSRWSSSQRRRIPLQGVVGRLHLPDGPGTFAGWLQVGTWVGIGKGVAFGQGRFALLRTK